MKRITLIAALLIAATFAMAVWSQGTRPTRPGPGGMGGPVMSCPALVVMPPQAMMIDHMAKSLQLTKDQTARLKKVIVKNEKTLRSLQQSAAKSSQALRNAITASKYSEKNVRSLAAKAERAEANVINASISEWTQIRSILTSSQSAKLKKAMSAQHPGLGQGPIGPPPGAPGNPPPGRR